LFSNQQKISINAANMTLPTNMDAPTRAQTLTQPQPLISNQSSKAHSSVETHSHADDQELEPRPVMDMVPGSFLKRQKRADDIDDSKPAFANLQRFDSFFSDKPNFELLQR
jgi:hypothetical protein